MRTIDDLFVGGSSFATAASVDLLIPATMAKRYPERPVFRHVSRDLYVDTICLYVHYNPERHTLFSTSTRKKRKLNWDRAALQKSVLKTVWFPFRFLGTFSSAACCTARLRLTSNSGL